MTKKSKLLISVVAIVLCAALAVGGTLAWFTDGVYSNDNIIQTGNLDVELYWREGFNDAWINTADEDAEAIFDYALWEPGYAQVRYLKIVNAGSLAFQFGLQITPNGAMPTKTDENGKVYQLSDAIDVYYIKNPTQAVDTRNDIVNMLPLGTLTDLINGSVPVYGTMLPAGQEKAGSYSGEMTMAVVLKMRESAGNEYQDLSIGTDFSVTLHAAQYMYEEDAFGSDYDSKASLPNFVFPEGSVDGSASSGVTVENGAVSETVTISAANSKVSATVPSGVAVTDGTQQLTLSVSTKQSSDSNVTLEANEAMRALDVHIDGIAQNNAVPMTVTLTEVAAKGLNKGNLKLYHVENGATVAMTQVDTVAELTAHNQFCYDPATGTITLSLASFSEVAVISDTVNAWNGTVATAFAGGSGTETAPYIIANADQLAYLGDRVSNDNENYGSAHYKLVANINIGGIDNYNKNGRKVLFYPIGYNKVGGTTTDKGSWYTYGGAFSGTFDGAGHTISNIYQNTWSMAGNYDNGYYNEAMGLFGYVNGGTVKNLTVDNFSSDGEYAPTGVIAAYAVNSTFENIAITNCNPRVYNTGNGGIVGIGGNSDDPDTHNLTFTNITIDKTNKITALWGSWDVACGGLVGMFRGDGHVHMTNCHVAAQMDVYNDVCGNYQYYWYRYSGMMVGTNKNMTTDANGYTVPETEKFHAKDCTVHFGEWNDYYYCELVDNTLASYTHDHQFSRLTEISSLDEIKSGDTWIKAGNFLLINGDTKTCYHIVNKNGELTQHLHTDAGEETVNGQTVPKEDKTIVYLPFNQLFTGYGWGVKHIPVGDFAGVTILDREVADSVKKFETKFTGDFLYRVGNGNAVEIGYLFDVAKGVDNDAISDSGVYVTIDKVNENSNVSGIFTANPSDWTKGTVKFSGTGVVKLTIQDYDYCEPTTLTLEVIDATNATGAANATQNNVVLLNDCGFSSVEVSGGYTLYGNGFTMTCGSDTAALDMGYAFVTLNSGTLDNVQIVCPNFDYAVLYKSNMTESGNRSETTDRTRYFNVKSGVMASGNSQILNSRISGGRAALNVSGGNVVVDNSRIELGAVANILVGSANSLTLRDVTLVQKPTVSTHDSSKTLMGFSVLAVCDANGDAAPITLEGNLAQYAWIDENDKQYVPSAGQSIISTVLAKTEYLHDIDNDGKNESLNLGIAYMPESLTSKVNTTTITDNRTNKDTIPYNYAEVSILNGKTYVYSYENTKGTSDELKSETVYTPNTYGDIITVTYSDTADGLTTGKSYGTDGWVYELNVDLDKLSGYALDFSKLSMSVNGVTVTDFKVDGSAKPTTPVAVVAGGTTYTLTATVDDEEYKATYKVTGTETSKESPSLVGTPSYGAGFGVANKYGSDWSCAAPVLDGITIKYWSVADSEYKEFALSSITFANTGKQNGTNNYWEYTHTNNDFTLKLTNTAVIHSSSGTYGMPVAGKDGKLYFTISSSSGFVSTGTTSRSLTMSYEFTDNNGGDTLKFNHTWSITYNKDEQYNYSSFTSDGTLTKLEAGSSSGGGCVTPDTLVTLANGRQVRVDSLTGSERLLVWNLQTGRLDSAPIMFVDSDPEAEYEIIHLYFSDGTDVKVISEHGFWDYNLGKYVYLDVNAAQYIGHTFAKRNGNDLSKVMLTKVVLETEVTSAWSPVTADHLCYFVNGMLSMPGGVGGLFNIFDVDAATMTYDFAAMERDIAQYGLYTYEELNAIEPLSEEMFEAAGGAYLKVSIGKGNLTVDELVAMIRRYSKYFG